MSLRDVIAKTCYDGARCLMCDYTGTHTDGCGIAAIEQTDQKPAPSVEDRVDAFLHGELTGDVMMPMWDYPQVRDLLIRFARQESGPT